MIKLAFISWHPAPYRDPLLRRLVHVPDIETTIYNVKPVDTGHAFWNLGERGYEYVQLTDEKAPLKFNLVRLVRLLVFKKYDVIALPVFMKVHFMVIAAALYFLGRKYVILSDSSGFRRVSFFYEWIRKFLAQRAALMMVQGRAGKELFLKRYGVAPDRFMYGVYALESKEFAQEVASRRCQREVLRCKYGLNADDCVFLMVANMIESRHYPITCSGFSAFSRRHAGCKFVICGRGKDLEAMQDYAKDHPEIVVVPGCSFDEMKSLYALADVYVHGGTEPASTALVFGAISNLPLLSTYAVGCSADVLIDGETGVDVGDYLSVEDWQHGFEKIYSHQGDWRRMGRAGSRSSQFLDADKVADSFSRFLLQQA